MLSNEYCKGCGACESICPVNALKLYPTEKGFKLSNVDEKKCVHCNLCEKVCVEANEKVFSTNLIAYAARSRMPDISNSSRSGGIFYELALNIIQKHNGIVYGVALEGTKVEYARVTDINTLPKLAGSKYVWCEHLDCLRMVEVDLEGNNIVLFSGLPCQVAALKAYLNLKKISQTNLILCDIICHGAPSKKLYKDYLIMQEQNHKILINKIDFRNKKVFGWKSHIETLYSDKKVIHSDLWAKIFYSYLAFNNSCFYCAYKKVDRVGDISLGDCWNIEKTDSSFDDNKGTSLLLINTIKGKSIIDKITNNIIIEEINIFEFMQPALQCSVSKPENYNAFWDSYLKYGGEYVIKKYVGYNLKMKCKAIAKIYYYKFGSSVKAARLNFVSACCTKTKRFKRL